MQNIETSITKEIYGVEAAYFEHRLGEIEFYEFPAFEGVLTHHSVLI